MRAYRRVLACIVLVKSVVLDMVNSMSVRPDDPARVAFSSAIPAVTLSGKINGCVITVVIDENA